MKLRLWSDLHLEFAKHKFDHIWTPAPEDADQIVLLAGDIDLGNCAAIFVEKLCENFKHVLYTPGNHEFWGRDYNTVIEGWRNFEQEGPKNFHFMYNDWRILDGVRFLGGTMWTSFNNADPVIMRLATQYMNDYREVRTEGVPLTPQFVFRENHKFLEFLIKQFEEPFDGKTVVMTHHSPGNPTKRSKWGRGSDEYFYFADIEMLIGNHNKANLWVHGHCHQNYDYLINETRVVCNPYGYHNHGTNPGFDKNLIIEI